MNKKIISVFLNIIFPGLGQLYLGQLFKALFFAILVSFCYHSHTLIPFGLAFHFIIIFEVLSYQPVESK